jgi:hypothetical protein
VVIHAPKEDGPTDSKGKSVIKPIRREEVKVKLPVLIAAAVGSLAVLGGAIGLGISKSQPPGLLLAPSAFLLALPLVMLGYWFLRDDELQGYLGRELWIRSAICALVFAIGWGLYYVIPGFVSDHKSVAETSVIEMGLMTVLMIGLGTAAAVLALELEIGQGLMLYMLYFVVTFVLAWISGAPLGELLPGNASKPKPGIEAPANPAIPADTMKAPPKILQ